MFPNVLPPVANRWPHNTAQQPSGVRYLSMAIFLHPNHIRSAIIVHSQVHIRGYRRMKIEIVYCAVCRKLYCIYII